MKKIVRPLIGLVAMSILLIYPINGLYYNWHARQEVAAIGKTYSELSDQELTNVKKYLVEVTKHIDPSDPFIETVKYETLISEEHIDQSFKDKISIPLNEIQDGAVGTIRLPSIKAKPMPIYIGASKEQLKKGIGYVPGTDPPLSGPGTHTILSGHRGYYGANLFLYIDYLVPGDIFYVNYLGEEAAYRVIGNEVVSAQNIEKLSEKPDNSEEWMTLLTCHPLPKLNDRLLVHAVRIPNEFITSSTTTHISETEWQSLGYGNDSLKLDRIFEQQNVETNQLVDVLPKQGMLYVFVSSILQDPTLFYEIILLIGGILWIRFFYLLILNMIKMF